MGKGEIIKKYVYISGLALRENNRGTAALGYGAISFLQEKGFLTNEQTIVEIRECGFMSFLKWTIKRLFRKDRKTTVINGQTWNFRDIAFLRLEKKLAKRIKFIWNFSFLKKIVDNTSLVAAINGGDGFADIYGRELFYKRLPGITFAMENKLPLIMLPQTIGPFEDKECFQLATNILKYASHVYVRDNCFIEKLKEMRVDYEVSNDLSYYMRPEPWSICINTKNAVGINVSGLAWDNHFHSLSGQFTTYPHLIRQIVEMFRNEGKTVYLIPHSYNYYRPELNNDDLKASRELYNQLEDKSHVILIDRDLLSPQVKYVISKMSFFVGTRMHANYAAIFTGVPLFGLAYSYKFKGAFEYNGINNRIAVINNLGLEDVDNVVRNIYEAYKEDVII